MQERHESQLVVASRTGVDRCEAFCPTFDLQVYTLTYLDPLLSQNFRRLCENEGTNNGCRIAHLTLSSPLQDSRDDRARTTIGGGSVAVEVSSRMKIVAPASLCGGSISSTGK
jgi:hypothetical protein